MNLLVTGAAGFIGSKIVELLLKRGDNVIAVDDLNDAYDVRLKEWRLDQLKQFENFSFYLADIANRSSIESSFDEIIAKHGQIEAIINLAARAGVRVSVENPWVYVDTNVVGTLNLLELCRKHKIKKFILASTSSLYGNTDLPFSEEIDGIFALTMQASEKRVLHSTKREKGHGGNYSNIDAYIATLNSIYKLPGSLTT